MEQPENQSLLTDLVLIVAEDSVLPPEFEHATVDTGSLFSKIAQVEDSPKPVTLVLSDDELAKLSSYLPDLTFLPSILSGHTSQTWLTYLPSFPVVTPEDLESASKPTHAPEEKPYFVDDAKAYGDREFKPRKQREKREKEERSDSVDFGAEVEQV